MTTRLSPIGAILREVAVCHVIALGAVSIARAQAAAPRGLSKQLLAHSVALPLKSTWQVSLSESLMLPVVQRQQGDLIVSTSANRIGLLRDGKVLWWNSIDSALLAIPAFVLADSSLATILSDGTFELRSWTDGSVRHSRRLPLSRCASGVTVSQHPDGTLTIACGRQFARVDATGRTLYMATPVADDNVTTLAPNLIVSASGRWFWQHRWRGVTPLFAVEAKPLLLASWQNTYPWRVLLDDSRVVRIDRDASFSFESTHRQDGPFGIEAIASTRHGDWLALDCEGTVTRHSETTTSVLGAIGPAAAQPRPAQSAGNRPLLAALSTGDVAASWPEQSLHVLRGATSLLLDRSHCRGQKQTQELPSGRLLLACGNGELAEYPLK